jgi:hypothetical protein
VDACGHLTVAGVNALVHRIAATVHVPAYDAVVCDSILVAYAIVGETPGRARPVGEARFLEGVPVYPQPGRGFARRWKSGRDRRFHLPAGTSRVLVVSAGNDLWATGPNLPEEIRGRIAGMKAAWEGPGDDPESYVDVLVIEDATWPCVK